MSTQTEVVKLAVYEVILISGATVSVNETTIKICILQEVKFEWRDEIWWDLSLLKWQGVQGAHWN